jgi:2-methylcitrate dehydratase PrpD
MGKQMIRKLAEFTEGLTVEGLDAVVVEKAKLCVLDAIACAFAGAETGLPEMLWNVTRSLGGEGAGAVLWGRGMRANPVFAAAHNSVLVHNMIHDDTNESCRGHLGNLVVPTVLALAETTGATGARVLPAIVAGYEVAGRIARPAVPFSVGRGFRGTSTYGAFGVAAATGKVLGLNTEGLGHAIASAASLAMGVMEPFNTGSQEWRLQNAMAVTGGMMAAMTAREGLRSSASALEGDAGFLNAFCGREVRQDIEKAWEDSIATLGSEFEISRAFFKPFAGCGYNQVACMIAVRLARKHDIDPRRVEEIRVRVSPENRDYPGVAYQGPFGTVDEALLSKPFAIGAAVVFRDLQAGTYRDRLNDPEILRVARSVRIIADESLGALDTSIRIATTHGDVFEGDLGSIDLSEFFPSRERMIEKFNFLARERLDAKRIAGIVDRVFDLERVLRVQDLTELLGEASDGRSRA